MILLKVPEEFESQFDLGLKVKVRGQFFYLKKEGGHVGLGLFH